MATVSFDPNEGDEGMNEMPATVTWVMSIKLGLLLSLLGNLSIGAIFSHCMIIKTSKEASSIESSATIYAQAWRTVLNDTFISSDCFTLSLAIQKR